MKLLELAEKYPEAGYTHAALQEGVEVTKVQFHPEGIKCVYPSRYPDGEPMKPYFGPQCPYMVEGRVNYLANFFYWPGGIGGVQAITSVFAEDENWKVYERKN